MRVILIEFNELCPPLLDRWMAEGKLPNFKRFHDAAEVFVTQSDEPEAPNLEPWIQWYSLHTGLPFSKHGVFHLTDGPRAEHPDIWRRLLDAGKTVWNCSSMNARRLTGERALFLPDPWCTSEPAHPAELAPFHQFIASSVQEYSNASRQESLGKVASFLSFMATHGLRPKTVMAILRQLLSERVGSEPTAWRRAAILDKLLFDVFRHYMRKRQPDFATFFVNSTAHLQHTYWRYMDPGAFVVQPDAEGVRHFRDAVLFGYQEMDRLVGDFFALAAETGATLMFATALSQQPYLKYEATGGHNFYRPRRVEALLKQLGIQYDRVDPVMTHQYVVHCRDAAARDAAVAQIEAPWCGNRPVFQVEPTHEATSFYFGCQLNTRLGEDAQLEWRKGDNQAARFYDWFYRIDELKSGRHHPDGCLWINQGRHRRHAEKVSILDVCPTVLGMFGMADVTLPGRDLLAPAPARQEFLAAGE